MKKCNSVKLRKKWGNPCNKYIKIYCLKALGRRGYRSKPQIMEVPMRPIYIYIYIYTPSTISLLY